MNSEGAQAILVIVADDQRLVRESIAALLDLQEGIEVVGTAADGREAVDVAVETEADVVLMDVRMPGTDGIAATRLLRERRPDCLVVMLTTFDDRDSIVEAMRAGARGYLLKDRPSKDLADAIRTACTGVVQFDPAAAASLTAALGPAQPEPERPPLSDREIEVLRLLGAGATNKEIAARLYLSEGTVKNHVSRILARLGLRDRTQAAIYARDRGLR
ncbi:response regulator transcription factor [Glycomyces dulcitolivorans]|uniref:response regulator transcription factor n=1 Tax=Glycomyces dulcitolivorans TaxID=2200759 RepID=UPI000DD36653|nr:response regulator transcription factor [Glycomyces dulcitolivorans]